MPIPTLDSVFAQLQHEGLVAANWSEPLAAEFCSEAESSAWYIRGFIALGAWFASLFLLGFIALLGWLIFHDSFERSALLLFSIVCLVSATLVRRQHAQEFLVQCCLAVCLAGEALLAVGIALLSDHYLHSYGSHTAETQILVSLILSQALLVAVYPDNTLRFLACIAMIAEAVILFYIYDAALFIHGLILVLAMGFVHLVLSEGRYYTTPFAKVYVPIHYAVLIGMLATMLLSTVYVLPELPHTAIFPRPWLSTLALGGVLLYTVVRLTHGTTTPVRDTIKIVCLIGAAAFIGLSWKAPGLVLSLLVILLGFQSANRLITGIAIAFFSIFLTTFFYGIEVSLLHKSYTLLGSGALLLVGWYLLRVQQREAGHA
ncbi:MAG: DUF4401 domain-containing protein [Gammaproteobacteria bacterium]|nr:DUF4401 domain-containing protein [Gammaproteobacteria bacterium]